MSPSLPAFSPGPWAQSVQHPSSGLTKEYIVTLALPPTARQLDTILGGCEVDNAFVTPVSLSRIVDQPTKLRIVVGEGRNREVRDSQLTAIDDLVQFRLVGCAVQVVFKQCQHA